MNTVTTCTFNTAATKIWLIFHTGCCRLNIIPELAEQQLLWVDVPKATLGARLKPRRGGGLTDVDFLLAGEVYRHAERKCVFIGVSHWKLGSARILQDPELPDLKMVRMDICCQNQVEASRCTISCRSRREIIWLKDMKGFQEFWATGWWYMMTNACERTSVIPQ